MVLFYCTFVAMKRQDKREVPHEDLLDHLELCGPEKYEVLEYSGQIRDGDLIHALRIWRDRPSGGFRLEACALRGAMKDVPLWTAFITKYAVDPDHVQPEGTRVVSLAALKPPPYVFLAGYHPLMNRKGEYVLHFTSKDGRPAQQNPHRFAAESLIEGQMRLASWRPGPACEGRSSCCDSIACVTT